MTARHTAVTNARNRSLLIFASSWIHVGHRERGQGVDTEAGHRVRRRQPGPHQQDREEDERH